MSGWLTPGLPQLARFTGNELFYADTQQAQGVSPESGAVNGIVMATYVSYFQNFSSKTTVAGSRYFTSLTLGSPQLLTGIQVLVGSVGGTDTWLVELHDVNGVLVANSALAGVTAGTAGTWQQIAFTAAYQANAGTYFMVLQTNGTTAHPAVYNFPLPATGVTNAILTGSSTGSFGTVASITPPTAYAQAVGPVALPY